MSTLVSAQGASFSGTLTATSAFTYTSSTTLLSATPVAGDYVFVAVWLTRATVTTAVQNANGTYGSVKCGTVFLTCMENTSVPTSLSGTTTTNFHAYNAATTIANNAPNIAIFGAPYTSGMSRQIVVTGYNSSTSTAILLVTAMAVQGIYTPASSPRTTWCNTIANGGVVDATSGTGLAWASNGTPSSTSFGSTKVNNSNLTSAIVDDVSAGAVTGVLNLGSTGYQTTQFSTRYANQQGLYTGTIDQYGFSLGSGVNFIFTSSSNNPIPPDLSGGWSNYTGNAKLAVGQSISGTNIIRDTYITSFGYDPNFFGAGPCWIIYTNQVQAGGSGIIYAGTEQPVLAVMLTNNSTVTAASTSVGNVTGTPNNGLTFIDPQGATNYVTTFGQSSGVVSTSTNTALPASGKMTVPTYGGNATMSWTSKPSSTSLAGCTIPATPSDTLLYQTWLDNAGFTPTVYWDNTPVLSNGSTQSTAPAIETPTSVIATGTTGFQIGSLVMTYGASRSGVNPVNLYGLLRLNGGTNYGFGAAFAFQPNKATIIGTVSEQVERDVSESSGAARTLAKNSELTEPYALSGSSALTLPRTSENSPALTSEIENSLDHAVVSETNETPTTENFSATSKSRTGAVSEINTGETGGRSLNGAKTNQANETPSTENQRVMLFGEKGTETTVAATTGNSRATNSSKTSEAARSFTSTNTRALSFVRFVAKRIVTTTQNAKNVAISRASAVAETPTTTSQRSIAHSPVSTVAEMLSGETFRSTAVNKANEVSVNTNGENAKQVARNTISSVAIVANSENQISKAISRATSVFTTLTAREGKARNFGKASALRSNSKTSGQANSKSVDRGRNSEVAEPPTTTSQRSVAHFVASVVAKILSTQSVKSIERFATAAVNLLIRSTVSRSVAISRASAVAQRFYTTAFAIILKISKGFIANFTEYPKTEGFAEKTTTLSFRDDGVASYTEGP